MICGDCVYRTGSIEPGLRDPIDKAELVAESICFRVQVGKGHLMSCISLMIRTWEKKTEQTGRGEQKPDPRDILTCASPSSVVNQSASNRMS